MKTIMTASAFIKKMQIDPGQNNKSCSRGSSQLAGSPLKSTLSPQKFKELKNNDMHETIQSLKESSLDSAMNKTKSIDISTQNIIGTKKVNRFSQSTHFQRIMRNMRFSQTISQMSQDQPCDWRLPKKFQDTMKMSGRII